jgi:Delta7-sterol 5-desaturase
MSFLQKYGILLVIIVPIVFIWLRYYLFAGTAYWFFYKKKRRDWVHRKIQAKFPADAQLRQERLHSMTTVVVFGIVSISVFFLRKNGFTLMYDHIDTYGWGYLLLSIAAVILLHDTYFYWTHRLMHHPKVFKYVHKVHHLSHNPTPWAAFAFHPLEAIVEAGIVPLAIFLIPLHNIALTIFLTYMIVFNVIGHLGFEIYPAGFLRNAFGKLQNTSTHHNMHHQLGKGNYGLYFNFWDKIMGTNFKEYEQRFEENAGRPKEIEGMV